MNREIRKILHVCFLTTVCDNRSHYEIRLPLARWVSRYLFGGIYPKEDWQMKSPRFQLKSAAARFSCYSFLSILLQFVVKSAGDPKPLGPTPCLRYSSKALSSLPVHRTHLAIVCLFRLMVSLTVLEDCREFSELIYKSTRRRIMIRI